MEFVHSRDTQISPLLLSAKSPSSVQVQTLHTFPMDQQGLSSIPDSSAATFSDLSLALKASLHQTPVYPALLSSLRSTLLTLLSPPSSSSASIGASIQRSGPPDNALINTLIEEYLSFNGFGNSRTVFRAECGMDVYEDEGLPPSVDGGASAGIVPRRAVELDLGLEKKGGVSDAERLETAINGGDEIPLIYSLVQRVRDTARGADVEAAAAAAAKHNSAAAKPDKRRGGAKETAGGGVGGASSGRGGKAAAGAGTKVKTMTARGAADDDRENWDGLGGGDRKKGATLKRDDVPVPGGIFLER